ncbi:MAG: GH3 auxin-responsive promoter family protein [Mogibacterium sp.]|nr:GH3 auxin-responsive promoter family protein [Mogibacterium sp.]
MSVKAKLLNRLVITSQIRTGRKALKKREENARNAAALQQELLMRIVHDNDTTEYGRLYHFDEIKDVNDYREKVPFSDYDDYAPYIERMIKNDEKGLITNYPVVHYAASSGSVGVPKSIPVTKETLDHYSFNGISRSFASADKLLREKTGKGMGFGRGLNNTDISIERTPYGITRGPISGAALEHVKKLMPYVQTSPLEVLFPEARMDMKYLKVRFALEEEKLMYMTSAFVTGLVDLMNYIKNNWKMLCDDIEKGIINEEIDVPADIREKLCADIKPNPKRAAALREAFKEGFDTPFIPRVWPMLKWIVSIGTGGFKAYTEKMREFTGPDIVFDQMVYAASEALMASATASEEADYVLLPDSCFYEFIPVDAEDETETKLINELEVGKYYEIVLTNLSGFYRYKIKDVIYVAGYEGETPRICFAYRKSQVLSIAGEKTNDESALWAVTETGKKFGIAIYDYTVYPNTDVEPGRYEVYIEPDHEIDMSLLPAIRDELDKKMGEANPSYGKKVRDNILSPMEVFVNQQETHALWRDLQIQRGLSGNQLKPVRVLDTPVKERFFKNLIEK